MADTNRFPGNLQVGGAVTCESITPRTGTLATARQVHRFNVPYSQPSGTDVTSKTEMRYIAAASGVFVGIDVFVETPPSGSGVDKQFTVDVKKSTGGGAFASILSSVVTINSLNSARDIVEATISSVSYIGGDVFQVVVTVSGSTGNQAQGMGLVMTMDEQPS